MRNLGILLLIFVFSSFILAGSELEDSYTYEEVNLSPEEAADKTRCESVKGKGCETVGIFCYTGERGTPEWNEHYEWFRNWICDEVEDPETGVD